MKNVLVTGSNGQLGSELKQLIGVHPGFSFTFIDIEDLDFTDGLSVDRFFEGKSFDAIINCAAYTAVDKAEEEREMAYKVNEGIPRLLANKANLNKAILVHVSTDFVFEGKAHKPLKETDDTYPVSIYGETKLAGEIAVSTHAKKHFIIRTSWLYSTFGKNFVKTILNLSKSRDEMRIVADQIGTPTYARDLAKVIMHILKTDSDNYGVYHFSNEGTASWFDFAHAIVELSGNECKVNPIPASAYPTPAKRPAFSLMDKSKIKDTFDLEIDHWTKPLKNCLDLIQD
ncbi:dTDP-4-dehydrorhamnose reductase [Roseivirga sp.]|uniref:dTDP-4-dehydrorhamnose reductase n=1 Tax=Roseivirga sp. TaxID=1964215 RepID=UPI003B8DD36D